MFVHLHCSVFGFWFLVFGALQQLTIFFGGNRRYSRVSIYNRYRLIRSFHSFPESVRPRPAKVSTQKALVDISRDVWSDMSLLVAIFSVLLCVQSCPIANLNVSLILRSQILLADFYFYFFLLLIFSFVHCSPPPRVSWFLASQANPSPHRKDQSFPSRQCRFEAPFHCLHGLQGWYDSHLP
jgi:hypothetical protein